MNAIRLQLDSTRFDGFETVEVFRTLEACAGTWSVSGPRVGSMPLAVGMLAQILVGEDLVLAGLVEEVEARLADDAVRFRARGRDLTADVVDCSAVVEGGDLFEVTLLDLVLLVTNPLGIEVDVGEGTDVSRQFERFGIDVGEGAWEVIDRACRVHGVLAIPSPTGSLLLTAPGTSRATVALEEGSNVHEAVLVNRDAERFRRYVVRTQRRGNDLDYGDIVAAPEGSAEDPGARQDRTLIIRAEAALDDEGCASRARWEAATRAARSIGLEVTVLGWREQEDSGPVWNVNRLVEVRIPSLGIASDMLIAAVQLTLDERGERATLTLTRPDAWQPEPAVPDDDGVFGAALEDDEDDAG